MFSRIRFLLILILVLIPVTIPGAAQAQTQTETDFTWLASYWNNRNLAGTPIVRRNESAIDYNWGLGSPDPLIKPNNFSARWTAEIDFNPATYRFAATSDDGMRVWVDGDLIIDQWYDHPVKTTTADKNLGAGPHRIVVEYYEAESGAIARFWWAPAPPADGNNWTGEYFNNTN